MRFEHFIKNGKVRRVEPDPNLAKALYQRSKDHLQFIDPLKIDKIGCVSIMTLYYESLRVLIEGFCEEEGYKVFSHEAFTAYLKEKGKEYEAEVFDRMRKIRNGINYYGEEITPEDVIQHKKDILKVIDQLQRWKNS